MRVPFPDRTRRTARLGRAFPGVAVEFWVVGDDEGCAQEQKAIIDPRTGTDRLLGHGGANVVRVPLGLQKRKRPAEASL
jgi:hypothetical protein